MTANLLARETSPYLLQHKDNPVHWMPWGDAAFAAARRADKPILLSIGYAACHWCHVMAHESFEDPDTAALMNANFINVKVDREERPDVDKIYMDALHALGEHGGWPMTMFVAPDGTPFWGGTYFPPEPRYGRPGFKQVLAEIARVWRDERQKVVANTAAIRGALNRSQATSGPIAISAARVADAARIVANAVDPTFGGLKGAPKFPQSAIFAFLWEAHLRHHDPALSAAVVTTLTNMCQGGIYDHLGGGLARYSVDHRWLVPHFEKMLYDNAQLVSLLSRAVVRSRQRLFRQRIDETVSFVLSGMATAGGAFASSYDADSEGHEGKYYVWTRREIDALLGPSAPDFARVYDVTPEGNWEGHSILNRLHYQVDLEDETEQSLARFRAILLAARANRAPPGFDDKVLADWNGLMITALAEAALVCSNPVWLTAARAAFERVTASLWNGSALAHAWRAGQTRGHATADDYANLISASLALHAASGARGDLDWASCLTDTLIAHYWDDSSPGFFFSPADASDLILRPKFAHDDATPNANGNMLSNLVALAALTGESGYHSRAEALLAANAAQAFSNPFAYPGILRGALTLVDPIQAILAGKPGAAAQSLLDTFVQAYGPGAIIGHVTDPAALPPAHPAHAKSAVDGPRLYICRGNTCAAPARTPAEVGDALTMLDLAGS
jgi:uncharacterized protein YyaL (SSP411 family)